MFVILFLSVIFHQSLEECLDKKVSITTDLPGNTFIDPLEVDSEQLFWHVAIMKQEKSERKFLCSGTVVEHIYVLTAASCVINVDSREIRVIAGLTLLRSPLHALENPYSLFTVAKKYYPFHRGGMKKNDLAILKLDQKAAFKTPQLTKMESTKKYSKQCFTLGWGVYNHSIQSEYLNTSFQDSVSNVLYHAAQNKQVLNKILDFRNFMGLGSMFLLQLSKMLFLPVLPFYVTTPKYSEEPTCPLDEFVRIKAIRLSTKHPYKCLCRNTNRICLYSLETDDIAQQVDIGSPVFCRLKAPKAKSTSQHISSEFILSGIITNKRTEEIHWFKCDSPVSMITAANVTALTDFILAVLRDKI